MPRKPHVRGELVSFDALPDEIADEILASSNAVEARSRLAHFLDQTHADRHKVAEDEAAQDIEDAIRVVRATA